MACEADPREWHVKQILAKTNSANRAEAVARVLGTPP